MNPLGSWAIEGYFSALFPAVAAMEPVGVAAEAADDLLQAFNCIRLLFQLIRRRSNCINCFWQHEAGKNKIVAIPNFHIEFNSVLYIHFMLDNGWRLEESGFS